MDSVVKKEFGIYIWSITMAFGIVLFEILYTLGVTPIWIFFFEFVWYASDALIAVIMYYYFKVVRSDLPIPVLTPVENSEVSDSTESEVIPE